MRTSVNTNSIIQYPDNQVFSGDLNNIRIIRRNTNVVRADISFTIGSYPYNETLLYFSNEINFSMSEILKLIFDRKVNDVFTAIKFFSFTVKIYSNGGLLETINLSIGKVILGKRRVFDLLGNTPELEVADYNPSAGITQYQTYLNTPTLAVGGLRNGSTVNVGTFSGLTSFNLSEINSIYGARSLTNKLESISFDSGKFDSTFDNTFRQLNKVNVNDSSCIGLPKSLGLRFINRFGLWRSYEVKLKTENISSSKGISLWYSEGNLSEINNLYTEQRKPYSQAITVYKESVSKSTSNDFSDIIYSDHVHIFDYANQRWLPIKVQTNSFAISEKETLFDLSLNLLLQNPNE